MGGVQINFVIRDIDIYLKNYEDTNLGLSQSILQLIEIKDIY
jgi:hypothetical protein